MTGTEDADEIPRHALAFRSRRFLNWFVLGLTYASFYVGRYNLIVANPKGATGKGALDLQLFGGAAHTGDVIACGMWVYALSELFVGAVIADRIGGRRALLIGAAGMACANLAAGAVFAGLAPSGGAAFAWLAVLFSINMFFQSFGAMSVVKTNTPWFHVRERGVFGGIFGIILSCGYVLAFVIGSHVLHRLPWYWVFIVPGLLTSGLFFVSYLLVRERPSLAGHADFSTGDASRPLEGPPSVRQTFRFVLGNPVLRVILAAEFCTGFVREGILQEFAGWLSKGFGIHHGDARFDYASLGITVGPILGGLLAGTLSDKVFGSRRTPVAFIYYALQIACLLSLGSIHRPLIACAMVGVSCAWIFGVHGLLSGTASMDFGGQHAAATAAGMLDGVQYIGGGILALFIDRLVGRWGFRVWGLSLVPFSVAGALLMLRVWNALPGAAARTTRAAKAAA